MGEPVTKQRKPAAPVAAKQDDQQNAAQLKNTQSPPPFQMKAEPIQRQPADAAPAFSPEVIAEKKAELDNDLSVLKPGEKLTKAKVNDPATVKRTLEFWGYKTDSGQSSIKLCGESIHGGINALCEDKIKAVNKAFEQLQKDNPAAAAQISLSLQKIGGRVYRIQKENSDSLDGKYGKYGLTGYKRALVSDHSLGCAIDINANQTTAQNDHFAGNGRKKGSKAELLRLVERVIKQTDESFDLNDTKGVDHIERINRFPEFLERYISGIIANGDLLDVYGEDEKLALAEMGKYKKTNNDIRIILANWNIIKGWAHGTSATKYAEGDSKVLDNPGQMDKTNDKKLDLVGLIDIDTTFVQMMLDAGFSWGGDFDRSNKDYMHFEDRAAMRAMKS